jgi:hypothetical protein
MSLLKIVVITLIFREIIGMYGVLVMAYYLTSTSWNSFWGIFGYWKRYRTRKIINKSDLQKKIESDWTLL